MSNAVYHRAYDEREPIEVRVESNRIEILSFPGPDRSVTIEGLKSYRVSNRRYRNRRIGDFLKELYLTEGRNTGFKKILDALDANGSLKRMRLTVNALLTIAAAPTIPTQIRKQTHGVLKLQRGSSLSVCSIERGTSGNGAAICQGK